MSKFAAKLRGIRKRYIKCKRSSANISGVNEWLCDNYYLYEREGKWTLANLKRANRFVLEDGGARVEKLCSDIVNEGLELAQKQAQDRLKSEELSVFEIDFLPIFYRKVLLLHIYSALATDSREGEHIIAYATRALKNASALDIYALTEKISPIEPILLSDPTEIYPRMSPETKAVYRRRIAILSKNQSVGELQFARTKLDTAREENKHIGEYLNLEVHNAFRGKFFLFLELLITVLGSVISYGVTRSVGFSIVAFLPTLALTQKFFSKVAMNNVQPDSILRMKTEDESVRDAKVLIVVSTIMPPLHELPALKQHLLELRYSYSHSEHVRICVLADLKAASEAVAPGDAKQIQAFKACICELNEKSDGGFIGAVRGRAYSNTGRVFTGKERKRGAIEALAACILETDTHEFELICGDTKDLDKTEYLLVLDSDTDLPMDAVTSLVSCAVHPINAKIYNVFVPIAQTKLPGKAHTSFAQLYAGRGGISAYNGLCSDKYQDLFGKSIFSGKGLINLRAFKNRLTGAFIDETVLSHDILEGEILGTKLVSDTCIAEGFPSNQTAFFKREDRWVRGDFQNIAFIFGGLKNGETLSALSKYKLADNIRRAITPIMQVLTLFLGGVLAQKHPNSTIFISTFTSVLVFLSLGRYADVLILGQGAFVNLRAAVKGLVRRFITHRNMLEWVTAAGSERKSDRRFISNFITALPSVIIGIALCFLPGLIKAFGVVFVLNPIYATLSAKPIKEIREVGWTEQEKLHEYAKKTWKYYEIYVGKTDNYLPPDNVQETPVFRIAHRTSPTNIGLLMLCTLSACDFGFIDVSTMSTRLENTLETVERLEKYRGNLLNWYDTITLNVLKPAYVSTVDSGNFVCMLTALKEGLIEYDGTNERIRPLVVRLERLIEGTDLSFLYDKTAKLFRIGYSVTDKRFSESYYDLLMSEARMTGYYAIARRQIPAEHFRALSRIMSRTGTHTGPLSWTGTMFEYYLPHLLLPAYPGSMSEHALKYCAYCQRRRVKGLGIPFGMSESGFYSFDKQLNYLYKAHGVQKLGLKRDLDKECVISPYSSFLLLPFDHKSALENLRSLEQMDMMGKCGFYEAIDFTASRTAGQDYSIVRSYMAHHVGMSMLSLANAAFNNVMQKRFMADTQMLGAKYLLMEKVPGHITVFKDVAGENEPQKPQATGSQKRISATSHVAESSGIYTNGEWTLLSFSNGMTESIYRGSHITVPITSCHDEYAGVRIFINTGGARVPVLPDKTIFKDNCVSYVTRHKKVLLTHTVGVHPRLPGEIHSVSIKNIGFETAHVEAFIWANPFLGDKKDGMSHPAFTKIFMTDSKDEALQSVLITKNSEAAPMSLACGFLHRENTRISTSNLEFFTSSEFKPDAYGVPDPCAAFELDFLIRPGKTETSIFFMGAGGSDEEANNVLQQSRDEFEKTEGTVAYAPGLFPEDSLEKLIGMQLLPSLICPSQLDPELTESIKCSTLPRDTLWKVGVSGDNPIVCQVVENDADIETAACYLRIISALCLRGVAVDMVICYDEAGNYVAPIRHSLEELVATGGELMASRTFLVDIACHDKNTLLAIKAASDRIVTKNLISHKNIKLARFERVASVARKNRPDEMFDGDAFHVTGNPKLPWCLCLANKTFGTLVSENSLGFTWAFNSRENKLTKHNGFSWQRDDGERILIKLGDRYYDLLKGSTATYRANYAEYTCQMEKCVFVITVYVPDNGMTKRMRVEMKNTGDRPVNFKIGYYAEPVLGVSRKLSKFLTASTHKNGITVTNEDVWGIKGYAFFGMSESVIDFWSCNALEVLSGNFEEGSLMPCAESCVFVGKNIELTQDEIMRVTFSSSFAKNEAAAVFLGTDFVAEIPKPQKKLVVDTGDKRLDVMINTWLPMQIKNSRMFGRCGFYQCGGAFGFRDQLQDAMNVSLIEPELAKQFIIRCSCAQFSQGDALHWWHNFASTDGGIKGIRTRCSDDMLWLPLAIARVVKMWGDLDFARIRTAFLQGEPLEPGERERYSRYERDMERETLYEHGKRALSVALQLGRHGLLKIGTCDWNDGYSKVGADGEGESVWLTMFWCIVADNYAELADAMGDTDYAKSLRGQADKLRSIIDESSWNGEYYLRAFYDDGEPMPGIDCLPQIFANLCLLPDEERKIKSLKNALYRLYDKEHGLVRLFWPPLTPDDKIAGYVNYYAPGTRENGGQYTHAAVWFALALLRSGNSDIGYEILKVLNPAEKYASKVTAARYLGEPYAVAGDVYSVGKYAGRAGWTLYTGAAGWFYRTAVEELLGIGLENGRLKVSPNLPTSIDSFTANFDDGEKIHKIKVSK